VNNWLGAVTGTATAATTVRKSEPPKKFLLAARRCGRNVGCGERRLRSL